MNAERSPAKVPSFYQKTEWLSSLRIKGCSPPLSKDACRLHPAKLALRRYFCEEYKSMYRIFILLLLAGTIAQARDLKVGRISGQVISQEGRPVPSAKVTAALQTGGPTVRVDRWGMTDDEGRFVIDHLAFGKYLMFAENPSDGYPSRLLWCFYGANRAITVLLAEANPSSEVDIELPPKSGKVVVRISNAKPGISIPIGVEISSRDGTCSVGTGPSANDTVQIPSGVDVDLTIDAAGYADWSYGDTHGGAVLNVKPDETVVLNVKLAPLNGH